MVLLRMLSSIYYIAEYSFECSENNNYVCNIRE